MCGRFRVDISAKEFRLFLQVIEAIDRRYADQSDLFQQEARDYHPGSTAAILTSGGAQLQTWGFPLDKKLIFNGRSESIHEKRMFSPLIKENRCLIPASSFYEWKDKRKYTIAPEGAPFFFMAGLYRSWRNEEGEEEPRFVILTTDADKEMSKIHTRMPVILEQTALKDYLAPEKDYEEIQHLLEPWNRGLAIRLSEGEQLSLLDE